MQEAQPGIPVSAGLDPPAVCRCEISFSWDYFNLKIIIPKRKLNSFFGFIPIFEIKTKIKEKSTPKRKRRLGMVISRSILCPDRSRTGTSFHVPGLSSINPLFSSSPFLLLNHLRKPSTLTLSLITSPSNPQDKGDLHLKPNLTPCPSSAPDFRIRLALLRS
jgi:hypothetical protein